MMNSYVNRLNLCKIKKEIYKNMSYFFYISYRYFHGMKFLTSSHAFLCNILNGLQNYISCKHCNNSFRYYIIINIVLKNHYPSLFQLIHLFKMNFIKYIIIFFYKMRFGEHVITFRYTCTI